jgi:hypothetical protein
VSQRITAGALAPALLTVVLLLTGCGSGSTTTTPAGSRLQREDFVSAARALAAVRPSAEAEVAAAKTAWPLVTNGLPRDTGAATRAPIAAASAAAAAIIEPPLFAERETHALTGTGAKLAGMFSNFNGLAGRGWRLIDAALSTGAHGTPADAQFARANSPLYIESVYDAHFILGQIGKQVLDGYEKLGGASAFGTALSQREVDALAAAYSEANDRLYPRATVKVGT